MGGGRGPGDGHDVLFCVEERIESVGVSSRKAVLVCESWTEFACLRRASCSPDVCEV